MNFRTEYHPEQSTWLIYIAGALCAAATLQALPPLLQPAHAYDFGCQYYWTKADADNSIPDCMKNLPSDNPGVLIPPVIPLVFLLLVLLLFPISFLCRCCGGCGSNEQRPGAACCCEGEEWDELPEEEKAVVYPPKHVFCIKVICVIVVILAIIPVVLVPVGLTEFKSFWDDMFKSVDADIAQWVLARINELKTELSDGNGSYISPVTSSMFSSVEDVVYDISNRSHDINDSIISHFDDAFIAVAVLSGLPLILLSCLLLFILCNVRKCLPATCSCIYFLVLVVFALFSILGMFGGVVGVLTCGEVTLFRTQSPGIFAWWALPTCEDRAPFKDLKKQVSDAEIEAAHTACQQLIEVCDTNLFAANTSKPFNCSLTSNTIDSVCTSITVVASLLNATVLKYDVPPGFICSSSCSIYTCPEDCTNADLKNQTRDARNEMNKGQKALNALRKAFTYADCDTLLTRFLLPFKTCNHFSVGSFLIAAGTGFGALFLLFGIILQLKGQKLFFKQPADDYADDNY